MVYTAFILANTRSDVKHWTHNRFYAMMNPGGSSMHKVWNAVYFVIAVVLRMAGIRQFPAD